MGPKTIWKGRATMSATWWTSRAKKNPKTTKQWRVKNISVKPFYFSNELVTPGLAGWWTVLWLLVSSHGEKMPGGVITQQRWRLPSAGRSWKRCLEKKRLLTRPSHPPQSCTSVCRRMAAALAMSTHWEPLSGRYAPGSWRSGSTTPLKGNCLMPAAVPACWPWCGTTRRSWWWQCIPLARQCCSVHERWGCRQRLRR